MLSKKLLKDVGVCLFAGENLYRRPKSATKFAHTASFCPFAIMSVPGRHLGAFSQ
jgi:hypothetical protein